MSQQQPYTPIEDALLVERPRMIRLCARLTGDWDAAEDLAQETLIEAWRHRDRVLHAEGCAAWLSAIARNVCLRWARAQGREYSRANRFAHALQSCTNENRVLERTELAEVLDQALASLPIPTRMALLARYAEDLSLAEVAGRLNMTENAVAVRLHRGKHTLQRMLARELAGDATVNPWQPTTLWCPYCGAQRLIVNVQTAGDGGFWLRCPDCHSPVGPFMMRLGKQQQRVPLRVIAEFEQQIHQTLTQHTSCPSCGTGIELQSLRSDGRWLQEGAWIIGGACAGQRSHFELWMYLNELALYTPAGLRFWRTHKRIRVLPDQAITIDGVPAFVTRFKSVTSRVRLEVIALRETCQVIRIEEVAA